MRAQTFFSLFLFWERLVNRTVHFTFTNFYWNMLHYSTASQIAIHITCCFPRSNGDVLHGKM